MRANQTGSDFGLRWTCLATSMAFAVAAAVHVLLWSWPEFSRARSAGTWPAVRGTVLRTDVTGLKRPRGWKPFESSHLVTVLASYEMGGVMLLHRKLWLESGAEDAAERSRGWPAGAEATFQCDPDEPGRIVGDPQAAAVMFAMPGMLALLSLTFGLFPLLSRSGRWAMEPERREMPRTGAIVIGISFVLLTAVCLAWGSDALGRVRMAREIAGWPEVEATVVRSEWVLSDGDRVTAVPVLAYRYERSGVMHESDAVVPVKPLLIAYADWNRRFLAHRPGERVTARVDPADPERAVIEWPEAGDRLAGTCGAAVFTLLGAAGTCNPIRSVWATRKPRFR